MATVFDRLKSMSFAGIAFPYVTYRVKGGIRDHVHEYAHQGGGSPEKLGRRLYTVEVQAFFQSRAIAPEYADLWPGSLSRLRTIFEQQLTDTLHIPTIGSIKAYAVDWNEESKNTNRSGVTVDMTFREDLAAALLVNRALGIPSLRSQVENWTVVIAGRPDTTGLFDGITQIANAILGVEDQVKLLGAWIIAKIDTLTSLCDQADQEVRDLDDPSWYAVVDALHDLWLAAIRLKQDTQKLGVDIVTFKTPIEMRIDAVARAVGVQNPADILQLNAISDPLSIPAGTELRYYAAA